MESFPALTFFIDRRYLFPFLVLLRNVSCTLPGAKKIFLGYFSEDLSDHDLHMVTLFASRFSIELTPIGFKKQDLYALGDIDTKLHFGLAGFGRLLLQERIADAHFYSDVDVLFSADIGEKLMEMGHGRRVGFVPQAQAQKSAGFVPDPQNFEFFAGFIFWPTLSARPRISYTDLGNIKTKYSTHDQALLNELFRGDYSQLDSSLCQLDNPTLGREAIVPGIVHYFGNWKPWQVPTSAQWRCKEVECLWNLWFEAEKDLLSTSMDSHELGWVNELRHFSMAARSKNLSRLVKISPLIKLLPFHKTILKVVRSCVGSHTHLIH